MRRKFTWLAASILLLAVKMVIAQPPDTLWTRTYGQNLADEGKSVQQTTDGGFIIAGGTLSFGADDWDALLIKTNNIGTTSWTRTYHYPGSGWDWAMSVQQTSDNGYIFTGETIPLGGGNTANLFLAKTNSVGDIIWTKSIGGPLDEEGRCVRQTSDGGYIAVGWTGPNPANGGDVYLVKTDHNGHVLWTRTFGPTWEKGESVQQTSDGGYIITGWTESGAGYRDVYLLKTTSDGYLVWSRTFGGTGGDYGNSVQQTSDGGYIVAGWSDSFGPTGVYLIRTNANGDSLWTRVLLHENTTCMGKSVKQTADGGYIITGGCAPMSTNALVMKTNANGNVEWSVDYGGNANDEGYCVGLTSDEGYIVAGWTYSFGAGGSDVYLIRMESEWAGILNLTLTPFNPPIIIPPGGDAFAYNIAGTNFSSSPAIFDVWVNIEVPGGSQFTILGPIYDLTLAAGSSIERDRTVFVPGSAPAGEYTCIGIIGTYPWTVIDTDAFTFVKEGADGIWKGSERWIFSGEPFPGEVIIAEESLPKDFALCPPYPNPFNPSATIRYSLPTASNVSLAVYDLNGRIVASLVNGWREAGSHEVTFDGSGLPSGIYLARLEAGEFSQVQKLVLLK